MDKEEIKSYLKRTDDLGARLTGEDKETYTWLIYGYNQCAKLLNEAEQQIKEQKGNYLEALITKHERAYEIEKLKKQQKEFILYLRHLSNWYSADGVKQGMVNEILQKYKEITGILDGKENI